MGSQHNRVCRRYARALFDLARENRITDMAYAGMQTVHHAFESSLELKVLMKSPIVREGRKQRILEKMLADKVHPLVLGYLRIIVRKQRASLLEGIAVAYLLVHKDAMGIESVRLTTAGPVDPLLREKALGVARRLTDKQIEFKEVVRPEIIGGFILNLGDRQYDASVRTRLSRLRRHLNV